MGLVEIVKNYLDENRLTEAVTACHDAKHDEDIRRNGSRLIPMLFERLDSDGSPELRACCEDLLKLAAGKADPDDTVFEFLDQMDEAAVGKFCFILNLLALSLPRCLDNKQQIIESSLVSIRAYMEDLITCDADLTNENEDDHKTDSSDHVTAFNGVIDFYSYFISLCETKEMTTLLSSRLIQMFDLFLHTENNTQFSEIRHTLLLLITKLLPDPFYLLQFIFSQLIRDQSSVDEIKADLKADNLRDVCDDLDMKNSDENISKYETGYIISKSGYAAFFYSLLCENASTVTFPIVYNRKFVFLTLVSLSVSFLEKSANSTVRKGLTYLLCLLNLLDDVKLERHELYFTFNERILMNLTSIMIYSEVEKNRKLSLECFRKYIDSYDFEGRYFILYHLQSKVNHSSVLGYLVTMLKDYTLHALNSPKEDEHIKYYSGKLLYDIIKQYCTLKDGEKTDLVENASHILSALNLIRFLVLKDKENQVGIRDYISNIEKLFLKPLENAIDSSKEFYQIKFEELNQTDSQAMDNGMDFTVNSQPFSYLSKVEQKNTLNSSLTAIELIKSLLCRVSECINDFIKSDMAA